MYLKVVKVNLCSLLHSELEARQYVVEHEALGKLKTLPNASINSMYVARGNIDNVLKNILAESTVVSEVLSSYRKKLPKKPQQPKEVAKKAA